MAELPSRVDLFSIGRNYIRARATRIDPSVVDVAGSDTNIFVGSQSFVAAAVVGQLSDRTAALTLDGAFGDDLDRLGIDRYGVARKGAAPARGVATLFRSSTTAGAGSVALGVKLNSLTGIEYITTTVATFGASDLSKTVNVRASQAGKENQVGKNQIRTIVSPGALFDPSLQVNNENPTAGGEPRENDIDYKERLRDFWRTARRGILAAIEFGAKTVLGVVSAQAVEALTLTAQPARVINLYIADSSGVANDALAADVSRALFDYRAGGIAVVISTSIPQIVTVQLRLAFTSNVDTATLTEQIRTAIFEFVNSLPVNGTLYRSQLQSVLQRFVQNGLIPNEGTVVTPTGDLVPNPGQTIRAQLTNIVVV